MRHTVRTWLFYYLSWISLLLLVTTNAHGSFIVGHRGARGLAPESTLQGYQTAIKLGVQYIDMDVVMTKDHQFVAYHDLALNPETTRDRHGAWVQNKILIKNLTLNELKSFNVGAIKPGTAYSQLFPHQVPLKHANIPSLRDVIASAQALNNNIRFQIEIKTDPTQPDDSFTPAFIAKQLVMLLDELHVTDRTRIQAFDWRCLYAIQQLNPKIQTAYLTSKEQEVLMMNPNSKIAGLWTGGKLLKNYHYSIPDMIKSLGGFAWDPESHSLTEKNRLRANKLGLQVVVWTDNKNIDYDEKEIKRVLRLKVDGIISDRPDLALRDIPIAIDQ